MNLAFSEPLWWNFPCVTNWLSIFWHPSHSMGGGGGNCLVFISQAYALKSRFFQTNLSFSSKFCILSWGSSHCGASPSMAPGAYGHKPFPGWPAVLLLGSARSQPTLLRAPLPYRRPLIIGWVTFRGQGNLQAPFPTDRWPVFSGSQMEGGLVIASVPPSL